MVSNEPRSAPLRSRFFFLVVVGWIAFSLPCNAQIEKPLAWLRDLTTLQNDSSLSREYRQSEATTIRKEVEEWVGLHSGNPVDLGPAPEGSWTLEQLNQQRNAIVEAIVAIYGPAVPQTPKISIPGVERDATLYPAHPVAPDFRRIKASDYVAPEFAEAAVKAKP